MGRRVAAWHSLSLQSAPAVELRSCARKPRESLLELLGGVISSLSCVAPRCAALTSLLLHAADVASNASTAPQRPAFTAPHSVIDLISSSSEGAGDGAGKRRPAASGHSGSAGAGARAPRGGGAAGGASGSGDGTTAAAGGASAGAGGGEECRAKKVPRHGPGMRQRSSSGAAAAAPAVEARLQRQAASGGGDAASGQRATRSASSGDRASVGSPRAGKRSAATAFGPVCQKRHRAVLL